jgi:hypothetical protein
MSLFNEKASVVHPLHSDGLNSPDLDQVFLTGQYWDFGT